jgi:hypothetical protein
MLTERASFIIIIVPHRPDGLLESILPILDK